MPGMGLGQCLQLSQKLEQKLVMQISLSQISELDTDGGKDVAIELDFLEKIEQDIDSGIYSDVANFVDRVGRRVPKPERTPSRRAIVDALRRLAILLVPESLAGVKTLIRWAERVNERWNSVPSDEYQSAIGILRSPCCPDLDARLAIWKTLRGNLDAEGGSVNLHALLADAAADHRFNPALFGQLLAAVAGERARVLDAYARHLPETLPDELDTRRLELALAIVGSYDRLLGHLQLPFDKQRIRRFVESDATVQGLPEVVAAHLPPTLARELVVKLANFFASKPLDDSIDAQRDVLQALIVFAARSDGLHCLVHALTHAPSAKSFARIARIIRQKASCRPHDFAYPLDAKDASELLRGLEFGDVFDALNSLHLKPGYRERFLDLLDHQPKIAEILLRLTEIYQTYSSDVLPALARITESVIDGNFGAWRYEHDAAASQLEPIRGNAVWRENVTRYRVLGESDELVARLRAVKLLQGEAATIFQMIVNRPWSPKLGGKLETEIAALEDRLRDVNCQPTDKRKIVAEARRLREVYKAARLIEVFEIEPTQVDFVRKHWEHVRAEQWVEPFRDLLTQGAAILDAAEVKNASIVQVSESDSLIDLLQVGVIPVLSCQRWTERTGYNQCLLAYVADPNKKLWQLRSRDGDVIGRVVVRLLPFKKSALVLLEPPYATTWSEEHMRAVVTSVLEKAARLAQAIGKPIAVGHVGHRRWSQWGPAFGEVCEKFGISPKESNFKPRLPESFNLYEYSDSMGGCLRRGEQPRAVARLSYIVVGGDDGENEE